MDYSNKIFNNYYLEDSDNQKVHRGNQEAYVDNYSDLLPCNKNAEILDIGCGAGQLLYYLKMRGYENIQGVDIGSEQIELVKKMGISACVISSLTDYLKSKIEYYDLIIMTGVIEHFKKDELLVNLAAIHKALKKSGVFVFATLNPACFSGMFQRYIDFTHEVAFTERSAYQVMKIVGFDNIKIKGDKIGLKLRPKRIIWWAMNKLWYKILGFIYYIEKGTDRPKILSRHLIVSGEKV